jgi:hypothetical protein
MEPPTLGKLYTKLVSWEQWMDLLHGVSGSSANAATRGGRCGFNRGNSREHGRGRGRGNGGNGGRPQQNIDRLTYQLCGKEGHTVLRYYKRFNTSFTGPSEQHLASTATTSYGVNTNWYTDTGATDHITGEMEKLTVRDKYHDTD